MRSVRNPIRLITNENGEARTFNQWCKENKIAATTAIYRWNKLYPEIFVLNEKQAEWLLKKINE